MKGRDVLSYIHTKYEDIVSKGTDVLQRKGRDIYIREYGNILIKKGRDFYKYIFIFMSIKLQHQ